MPREIIAGIAERKVLTVQTNQQENMMRFTALTDLTLPDGSYVQAGETFTQGVGYRPPTNACNPLDAEATAAYQAEGPRGCDDAEPWRALFTNCNRWQGKPVPAPALMWVKRGTGDTTDWVLVSTQT